jgi:streptomycin 6-kinase
MMRMVEPGQEVNPGGRKKREPAVPMPANLVSAAAGQDRQWWLPTIPAAVREMAEHWDLYLGQPYEPGGTSAWVAPADGPEGESYVLKVFWRHFEAEHEAEGLRFWNGEGSVLVHADRIIDEHTAALLLERCQPGTVLGVRPEAEQDVVIAGLFRRLWQVPPAASHFRPLAEMCQEWADEFEMKVAKGLGRLDPGLQREGIALFRSLPESSPDKVLLCTDLHAENVLAAEREPWLIIDPKPYVGDRAYDVLQHMLNCRDRLQADPVGLARTMAELTDLDTERVVVWLFARCVQESPHWPDLASVAERLAPVVLG